MILEGTYGRGQQKRKQLHRGGSGVLGMIGRRAFCTMRKVLFKEEDNSLRVLPLNLYLNLTGDLLCHIWTV